MNNKKTVVLTFPLLTIMLILKLTGTVSWAWWIILLPLYLPFAIFGGLFLIGFIIAFILALIAEAMGKL